MLLDIGGVGIRFEQFSEQIGEHSLLLMTTTTALTILLLVLLLLLLLLLKFE